MANRRFELHELLCGILGSRHVYFQPPESIKMTYPAIVYNLDYIGNKHADDGVYSSNRRYQVIIVDANPDSELIGKVNSLPLCQYNRHYEQDNLNHDVFTLYY